jgi:hypothetical protein
MCAVLALGSSKSSACAANLHVLTGVDVQVGKIKAIRKKHSSCRMVGSQPRTDEPANIRKENAMNDSSGIQTGRISKKRGLSRHYPHKAQSFDCIADLLCGETHFGDSSLVLSKTVSMRCIPAPSRTLSALRRVSTAAALSEQSGLSEDSVVNTWVVLDEQSLCSALEGTTIQDSSASQAQVRTCT